MKATVLMFLSGCLGELEIPVGKTDTASDAASDTSGETGGGSTNSSETGSETGDVSDSGTTSGIATVIFETTFGSAKKCVTEPFFRSDAGSMDFASYVSDDGECGVYVFGGGNATGPELSLVSSRTGLKEGVAYIAQIGVINISPSPIEIYADLGGGIVKGVELDGESAGVLTVVGEADAFGAATLRVWSSSSTNYEGVITDLVIGF